MDNEHSYMITQQMCMTKDVGTHGNLFGGNILAWIDEAGAIFARRYTGEEHVVTVHLSEFDFKHPVKVGEIIEFIAVNPKLGRTSITFDLDGVVDETTVVHTTCTFVALYENGAPKEVKKSQAFEKRYFQGPARPQLGES